MRASSCVTLPGTTHASIEYSPVAVMSCWNLRLAVVEACALPPRILMPQPPTQVTSPLKVQVRRRIDAAGVERGGALAALELVSAIRLFS